MLFWTSLSENDICLVVLDALWLWRDMPCGCSTVKQKAAVLPSDTCKLALIHGESLFGGVVMSAGHVKEAIGHRP